MVDSNATSEQVFVSQISRLSFAKNNSVKTVDLDQLTAVISKEKSSGESGGNSELKFEIGQGKSKSTTTTVMSTLSPLLYARSNKTTKEELEEPREASPFEPADSSSELDRDTYDLPAFDDDYRHQEEEEVVADSTENKEISKVSEAKNSVYYLSDYGSGSSDETRDDGGSVTATSSDQQNTSGESGGGVSGKRSKNGKTKPADFYSRVLNHFNETQGFLTKLSHQLIQSSIYRAALEDFTI
jgi:hypothetical protein